MMNEVCLPVPQITNGKISGLNQHFNTNGDKIYYTCNEHYVLQGNSERTCRTRYNQGWSGSDPVCTERLCDPPGHIDNGKFTGDNFKPDDIAEYTCNQYYEISGESNLTCKQDFSWSADPPTCERAFCDPPGDIDNGTFSGDNFKPDDIAEYTCNQYYEISGESKLTCKPDFSWSADTPTCERVFCDPPGDIDNGTFTGDNFKPDDIAEYTCNQYYEISGETNLTCKPDFSWSADTPTCERVFCDPPGDIDNGTFTGDNFKPDDIAEYTCNQYYEISGETNLTCKPDFSWSADTPTCERVFCDPPGDIDNGTFTGDNFKPDDIAEYTCNQYYVISGESNLTCKSDFTWSADTPTCERAFCDPPGDIDNGTFTGDNFKPDDIAEYTCNQNYEISGETNLTCKSDFSWSADTPTCERVFCDPPGDIDNGTFTGDNFKPDDIAEYTCNQYYEISGESKLTCKPDFSWSADPPTCERAFCDPPGDIDNGTFTGDNFKPDDIAEYTCNEYYEISGETNLTCKSDFSWSADTPTCERVFCDPPGDIDNGTFTGDNFKPDDIAEYTCNQYYEISGESNLTCKPDFSWSADTPTCERACCDPPGDIDNGTFTGDNFKPDDIAEYTCNQYYEISGETNLTCQSDFSWSADPPTCERSFCFPPGNTEHGQFIGYNFKPDEIAEYACDYFYKMKGESKLTCKSDFSWSGKPPTCHHIIQTSQEAVVTNAEIIGVVIGAVVVMFLTAMIVIVIIKKFVIPRKQRKTTPSGP